MHGSILQRAAVLAGAAGLLATLGAASASAAVTPDHGHGQPVTAVTKIIARNDSGGNGTWAYDGTRANPMVRTLTINPLGVVTPAMVTANPALAPVLGYHIYNASLADKGGFLDIPGAYTPNQGGRDLGKVLKPVQVAGTFTGFGDFGVFYASSKVNSPHSYANLGVPIQLRGAQNLADPSSTWPELAFPAGTTFVGLTEFDWGYTYTVPGTVRTVVIHGVKHVIHGKAQTWADTAANGDGQLRGDGNITGR
jgi:hypothetical protein